MTCGLPTRSCLIRALPILGGVTAEIHYENPSACFFSRWFKTRPEQVLCRKSYSHMLSKM